MSNGLSGVFVCIVGPSGAGKDTLLAHARQALENDDGVVFPRRLVTRGQNSFEDHDSLTEEAFAEGERSEAFALHWRAHDLGYALPLEVRDFLGAGRTVVCNISRSVVPLARTRFENVRVVLITAPPGVIAERLRSRARETTESIASRMERSNRLSHMLTPDLTIMNTGPVEKGAERLVSFIQSVTVRPRANAL